MGKKLNTAQQKAVCHETGPMLVLAGPGSGKTTVLLCRISRLLERGLAKPQEILALTFSKAAAEEMKSRFENLNGASGVSFGTFHSIFFRILRSRYGWNVEHFQIIGKRIGEAAGNPCADLFQSGGGRNEKPI